MARYASTSAWQSRATRDGEPGSSLRAELRRLRKQQHVMVEKFEALLSALQLDPSLFTRLAQLGVALESHQMLDQVNGRRLHYMGGALAAASPHLPPLVAQLCKDAKKGGDRARHDAFDVVHIDDYVSADVSVDGDFQHDREGVEDTHVVVDVGALEYTIPDVEDSLVDGYGVAPSSQIAVAAPDVVAASLVAVPFPKCFQCLPSSSRWQLC